MCFQDVKAALSDVPGLAVLSVESYFRLTCINVQIKYYTFRVNAYLCVTTEITRSV